MGRRTVVVVATVLAILLVGASTPARDEPPGPVAAVEATAPPDRPVTVIDATGAGPLAVAASATLLERASAAVLVTDGAPVEAAAAAADDTGVPVFPIAGAAADVRAELDRLGVTTVWAADDGAARWATTAGLATVASADRLPDVRRAAATDVLVLSDGSPAQAAAASVARAAGARVGGKATPDAAHVVALGSSFGTAETLTWRLAVARTGVQVPGGGQALFPGRRMIALYGHPGVPALGVLGEQDVAAAVARARDLAASYDPVVDEPVVPAFELITTIADSGPGPDGDYSAESTVEFLRPWVDAAGAAGMYVLLDLQPGRTDFLTQARRYAELLALPHVGLALDPEWRLKPDQTHLRQIGSVGVDEVNAVITWLADLTRQNALPQKLLMLHQFRTSMILGRERLDTSRDELAVLIHADGFGDPGTKLATWTTLHADEPANITWGWKNFIDEDTPMFTPAQTMQIGPTAPVFVSYQ